MNTITNYDFSNAFQVLKDIEIEVKAPEGNDYVPTTYHIQDILKMFHEEKWLSWIGVYESFNEYKEFLREVDSYPESTDRRPEDLKEQAEDLEIDIFKSDIYIIELLSGPKLIKCASRIKAELALLRELLGHLGFDEEDYIIK